MKKARPYLILLIALLVGWAAGSYFTDNYYEKWIQRYLDRVARTGAGEKLYTLDALRSGDTNKVAELLESQLDDKILNLGGILQNLPADQRLPVDLKLIAEFKEYRQAHPRKSSLPGIDERIAGVLTMKNMSVQP